MVTPRLTYFELRGRGEAIRLILHAQQVDFHDHRVHDSGEWRTQQAATAFGRLPVYESGTLVLCESQAILRHLGRAAGG